MSTSTLCRARRQAVFADAEDHEGRRQRSGHWVAHDRLQNGPEGGVPAAVLRAAPGQKTALRRCAKAGRWRALCQHCVCKKAMQWGSGFHQMRQAAQRSGEQDESVHVRCSVAVAA